MYDRLGTSGLERSAIRPLCLQCPRRELTRVRDPYARSASASVTSPARESQV